MNVLDGEVTRSRCSVVGHYWPPMVGQFPMPTDSGKEVCERLKALIGELNDEAANQDSSESAS